jgi:hypothetical protein
MDMMVELKQSLKRLEIEFQLLRKQRHKDWFQVSLGIKLRRSYLKNNQGIVVHAYNPNNSGGGDRRILVGGWPPAKAPDPI